MFKVGYDEEDVAVRENPYNKWKEGRKNSDYRCTDTQVTSLVRQQLSQPEYLRSANRVNPGPLRNKRTAIANSTPQIPHVFGPEDMWGWQPWAQNNLTSIGLSGLRETVDTAEIPGASYYPYNRVGGATYVDMQMNYSSYISEFVDTGESFTITPPPTDYISGIGVDTGNLNGGGDNMVLIYKSEINKFIFLSASQILGLSDGNTNLDDVDLGIF